MADPIASLTGFVQNAIATSFGEEWRDADPVIRPANKKQTSADVQVNAAMALAKKVGKNPREVATAIVEALKADSAAMQLIWDVEIAGPGFLNITLDAASAGELARSIVEAGEAYGRGETWLDRQHEPFTWGLPVDAVPGFVAPLGLEVEEILDAADLVTEMTKVRHPFDAGQRGQAGIEW